MSSTDMKAPKRNEIRKERERGRPDGSFSHNCHGEGTMWCVSERLIGFLLEVGDSELSLISLT